MENITINFITSGLNSHTHINTINMWNHQEITTVIATNNFIRDHQNRAAKKAIR
jgi:hypothetical protein